MTEKPENEPVERPGTSWARAFECLCVVAGIVAIVYINVRW